jgi:hypothetical protein
MMCIPDKTPKTDLEKLLAARQVTELMSGGHSLRSACAVLGLSPASVLRWQRLAEAEATQSRAAGRPAKWVLSTDDRARLRWLFAKTECQSLPLAVEYFVEWAKSGACPLPVPAWSAGKCAALGTAPCWDGEKERKKEGEKRDAGSPSLPLSVSPSPSLAVQFAELMQSGGRWDAKIPRQIRQACALSDIERAELLGEKAANGAGFKRQRTLEIRVLDTETGEPVLMPLWAGALYCSDDMSVNETFRAGSGSALGRQLLATHDVFSRKWLGLTAPGRAADAYTAVDIADHFSAVVRAMGLPFGWQLERGPWDNDFINGVALPDGWGAEGERWGGLASLFRICRKFNPQGKTIEGAFDYLQSRMAGRAMGVGRVRGGHEQVSRLLERAKAGNEEALRMVWSIGEAVESVWQRMQEDNARAKRRVAMGDIPCVPNELWSAGHQRREMPAGEAWRMLPVKVCRVVRSLSVWVRLDGYGPLPYQFRMAGDDLPWGFVDNGMRVAVAFHPDYPERGAAVASLETRSAYNRQDFRFMEVLGTAPHVAAVPMEDFTGTGDYSHQKAARAAVRQEVRAGGMDAAGLVRMSRAADGLGTALAMVSGPGAAESATEGTAGKAPRKSVAAAPQSLAALLRAEEAQEAEKSAEICGAEMAPF